MADVIRLAGVHPALDGDYDLTDDFNKWELHCIKRLTGLAGTDLVEAFPKGDPDVLVALGMVALMRAGKITGQTPWDSDQVQSLWTKGDISDVSDEEGKESLPPENASAANGRSGSSGESSTSSSESPDEDLSPIGASE